MARLFGWLAGLVGIAALARVLARRRRSHEGRSVAPPFGPDPADELRRKLDETREETAASEAPEQEPAAAEAPSETLDERRSRVHAKAQEAIEAMQDPPQ